MLRNHVEMAGRLSIVSAIAETIVRMLPRPSQFPTACRGTFIAAASSAVFLATVQLQASLILPSGLAPGSQYEIAFVTTDGTTATDSNLADYNSFVTAEAKLNATLGGTWHAIASTSGSAASANAPASVNIPIYNTHGQLVVAASTGYTLYTTPRLLDPIDYDQNGNVISQPDVWTGTDVDSGAAFSGAALGASAPVYGDDNSYISNGWLALGFSGTDTTVYPLYALSSPYTVPVPEPAALALLAAALPGLAGAWHLRRRGKQAA
jgi:hypothetical protein